VSGARRLLLLAGLTVVAGDAMARPASTSASAQKADQVVRLFRDACVAHLGRSSAMGSVIKRSGLGFRQTFAGHKDYGPVWSSAQGRIVAYDDSHNHDGEECQINLRRQVAPSAAATIASLRRHGLVRGSGRPAEFGATVFRSSGRTIMVRYDIPSEATGVREADAGLTLLIQQPPV
jgi:hypothetical protein